MAPQGAVAWDFDAIMPALRDPRGYLFSKKLRNGAPRRQTPFWKLLRKVRLKKRGHRELTPFTRWHVPNSSAPTSTVPAEIKDATVRRREALRHRQSCWEALAVTISTDSLLALAWTTWVEGAQTETCDQTCSSMGTDRSSITTGQNML